MKHRYAKKSHRLTTTGLSIKLNSAACRPAFTKKGDKVFLYTDGVPETTNSDNQMFAMERTLDTLKRTERKQWIK
ncbi:MAG: SpoIIE family protein phosphatase [Clostridia bacterium]|nr:SpoIIE family protein phosphatase [Clostridia bacterium]